jgi:hypothetical protein
MFSVFLSILTLKYLALLSMWREPPPGPKGGGGSQYGCAPALRQIKGGALQAQASTSHIWIVDARDGHAAQRPQWAPGSRVAGVSSECGYRIHVLGSTAPQWHLSCGCLVSGGGRTYRGGPVLLLCSNHDTPPRKGARRPDVHPNGERGGLRRKRNSGSMGPRQWMGLRARCHVRVSLWYRESPSGLLDLTRWIGG